MLRERNRTDTHLESLEKNILLPHDFGQQNGNRNKLAVKNYFQQPAVGVCFKKTGTINTYFC